MGQKGTSTRAAEKEQKAPRTSPVEAASRGLSEKEQQNQSDLGGNGARGGIELSYN